MLLCGLGSVKSLRQFVSRRLPFRLFSNISPVIDSTLLEWPGKYRIPINNLILDMNQKCLSLELQSTFAESSSWNNFKSTFRRSLMKDPLTTLHNPENLRQLCTLIDSMQACLSDSQEMLELKQSCYELFADQMRNSFESSHNEIAMAFQAIQSNTDLRHPHLWYPMARLTRRKIIFHGGPTNSGKTYHALERLKKADPALGGGIYCGPLRLLALEVYDSLNRAGVYADLATGQEKRVVPFSTHISCTIEMTSISRPYDVAVIDEIQMIGDEERGSAWTRALLGLQAREIHVCGGSEARDIVKSLVESAGDDFEFINYHRLSSLKIAEESLQGDYSKLRPGDCVVAFSRADIFSIRREIEAHTPYKCAVIYGQLPPETRSMQARLFNDPNTGFDILVASDAIGMGLNLNIGRVVFHTTLKNGKRGPEWLTPSSVKQIGGRAGRKSSQFEYGEVTAWQDVDLAYIRAVFSEDIIPLKVAGIFPSVEQIHSFSVSVAEMDDHEQDMVEENMVKESGSRQSDKLMASSKINLNTLLSKFIHLAKLSDRFFLCNHDSVVLLSNWLQPIPLTLEDRFTFANAPVNLRDNLSLLNIYIFAAKFAAGRPVALNIRLPANRPSNVQELEDLCLKYNNMELYSWLSLRYPRYFIESELCLKQKVHALEVIEDSLDICLQGDECHNFKWLRQRKNLFGPSDHIDLANLTLPPLSYGGEALWAKVRSEFSKLSHRTYFNFPLKKLTDQRGQRSWLPSKSRGGISNSKPGANPKPLSWRSDHRKVESHSRKSVVQWTPKHSVTVSGKHSKSVKVSQSGSPLHPTVQNVLKTQLTSHSHHAPQSDPFAVISQLLMQTE